VKAANCVTNGAGTCVLMSGTPSYGRSWVTLNVTGVVWAGSLCDATRNRTQAGVATTA